MLYERKKHYPITTQIKMKNKNVSRKKRRKKKYRLGSLKEWIRDYTGDNIVVEYSKWYSVDLICAIKELRLNGIEVSEKYENKVKESIAAKKETRKLNKENRKKRNQEEKDILSDERFAFIAGYTSGGAAYGITHEEMEIQLKEDSEEEIDINEIFKN